MAPLIINNQTAPSILAAARFGSPRTYPDCIYIGICNLSNDDDDEPVGNCDTAKAWAMRTETGLRLRFVRSTVQPCAMAKQFAGNIFRTISPYELTKKFAASLGLPKNTAWEIPQGDFPVRPCAGFLTVDFPLRLVFEIKKSRHLEIPTPA